MRRKIHGVFGIIEGVNVQIDFDPVSFTTRARLPRRSFMRRLGAHALTLARAESLTVNQNDFIRTVAA